MRGIQAAARSQQERNQSLLAATRHLDQSLSSRVLPLHFEIDVLEELGAAQIHTLEALQVEAARIAVRSLASLARIGELDHLGGGLELIPSLLLTLSLVDYHSKEYTIEHAHTSIGYYSALATLGFIDPESVVEGFRRGLEIPGHVSWLPGGTQLNGGRLGVMVPAAVGQALGKRALHGERAWVVVHLGDAGWISGQALNGFNAAGLHGAPITFVMHRNGIQLSGTTRHIMDRDPRPIIASVGIEILEIPTLHDAAALYQAYRQGRKLAQQGRPSLIYPRGYRSTGGEKIDLQSFGRRYGIEAQTAAFAAEKGVALHSEIWIPGSLMSFRDPRSMLECLFLVNQLPGGAGHHDGHMKGRDEAEVLANPMLQMGEEQKAALEALRTRPTREILTRARPAPGTPNMEISARALEQLALPEAGASESPRTGSEAGYLAAARSAPGQVFVVSCDLDPSTKLGKAAALLAPDHSFEMSIEEQAAALLANGLAASGGHPQLNVVSTFAAFFEGIAREGFEMWRYQRNLNGVNEGLNVTFHLSHVGACTGRDHFSGWGLDWINIGLTYLPFLHRFYAPADARAAFAAVCDLASHYGGHLIGVPRDKLPVLARQDGSGALWNPGEPWEAATQYRGYAGARRLILAFGAPAFLAAEAAEILQREGASTDVYIVNGLPLPEGALEGLLARYPEGVVTVEDGFIGTAHTGVRGFAGLVATAASARDIPAAHVGITDVRVAPSAGHMETWAHFGISAAALVESVKGL